MGSFESINNSNIPEKVPLINGPTLDEQKEEDKMLLQEYRRLLEEEEDTVAQYALVEKIVDLEMKEYYKEDIDAQEKTAINSMEQTENDNAERVDVWKDIGYNTGFTNKEFPHPTKSTKTTAEKEAAKKIAIEKALKKRQERNGHIGYIDPLDTTL